LKQFPGQIFLDTNESHYGAQHPTGNNLLGNKKANSGKVGFIVTINNLRRIFDPAVNPF
jgi:hypothetical protein